MDRCSSRKYMHILPNHILCNFAHCIGLLSSFIFANKRPSSQSQSHYRHSAPCAIKFFCNSFSPNHHTKHQNILQEWKFRSWSSGLWHWVICQMAINNSEDDTTPPPLGYKTDGSRMCLRIGKVRDFYEIYILLCNDFLYMDLLWKETD